MRFGVAGLAAEPEKVNLKWGLHLLGIENSKIINNDFDKTVRTWNFQF